VLYNIDDLLNALELDDIVWDMKAGGVLYLAGLILYLIVTWIIYDRRYEIAKRGLNVYLAKLKRLSRRYEYHDRTKEMTKEGSIHDGASRN
jgi:hypothetical protein